MNLIVARRPSTESESLRPTVRPRCSARTDSIRPVHQANTRVRRTSPSRKVAEESSIPSTASWLGKGRRIPGSFGQKSLSSPAPSLLHPTHRLRAPGQTRTLSGSPATQASRAWTVTPEATACGHPNRDPTLGNRPLGRREGRHCYDSPHVEIAGLLQIDGGNNGLPVWNIRKPLLHRCRQSVNSSTLQSQQQDAPPLVPRGLIVAGYQRRAHKQGRRRQNHRPMTILGIIPPSFSFPPHRQRSLGGSVFLRYLVCFIKPRHKIFFAETKRPIHE